MVKAICGSFAPLQSERWGRLTQHQISDRCRARAEMAIAHAEGISSDLSIAYLETAEAWTQLAEDIAWAAEKTALGQRTRLVARQLGKVT